MLSYLLYAYTIIHKYTFWMLDLANSRIFVVEMIQTIVWSAVHTNNFQMQARVTWLFSNKLTQLNKLLYYTCHVSYKNELLNGIVRQEKSSFRKIICAPRWSNALFMQKHYSYSTLHAKFHWPLAYLQFKTWCLIVENVMILFIQKSSSTQELMWCDKTIWTGWTHTVTIPFHNLICLSNAGF